MTNYRCLAAGVFLTAIVAIGVSVGLALAGQNSQVPTPPADFIGQVTIRGSAAPQYLALYACVRECAEDGMGSPVQTKAEGRFENLRISGDVGAEVTFWIVTPLGPVKAAQTLVLNPGLTQIVLDFPRIVPETIPGAAADVNGDGVVDTRDLSFVARNLGLGVPTPTPMPSPTPTATPTPTPNPTPTPSPTPQPTTVTIGPSKDNTLLEDANGNLSNVAGPGFIARKTNRNLIRRGLIEFDIESNIPQGSTVTDVALTLHLSQTSIPSAQNVSLHVISREWGEGASNTSSGQGAKSAQGDAIWVHTFFDDEFWSSLGGDFTSAASSSTSVSGNEFYTWGSTSAMVTDVREWLDDPSTNHGWLLKGNESSSRTAKRFDTRENGNSANRPVLTITFIP